MSNNCSWEPVERDLDAVERNIIRDSFAEVVQAHGLDLEKATKYLADAINEYREKVEYHLVEKITRYSNMRNCQNRCGRRVYVDGQHPICQYCREKASRRACPDCGDKISANAARCVHCALKHQTNTRKSNRKKLKIGKKKPDD